MKKISSIIVFFILIIIPIVSGKSSDIDFSYQTILDREFRFNEGDAIPLTVGKAISTSGDISLDGRFLYYASNRENGNFDIYLRSLDDITVARLTTHPARDTAPAISPNGRRLAFVSNRENPEGDVYVLSINPKSIIDRVRNSVDASGFDSGARNLTQLQDPVSGTVRMIRNDHPAWSPDGRRIVFSSNRSGADNIWIIDENGRNLSQVTQNGGIHPKFSPDGREIIFISYQDSPNGNVYVVDIDSGTERRLTNSNSIKLFPGFAEDEAFIYTEIARDTNRDGVIDLRDSAVIMYVNPKLNVSYNLTLESESSFAGRHLPIFGSAQYNGIVVFSGQIEDNINLYIVPNTGIIPKRTDAFRQYEHALRYRTDFANEEKYILALEMVSKFFASEKDVVTTIFSSKALADAAVEYQRRGNRVKVTELLNTLERYAAENQNVFTTAMVESTRLRLRGASDHAILQRALADAASTKDSDQFIPFILDAIGDTGVGNPVAAYSRIIREYPRYPLIRIVQRKAALASETAFTGDFSEYTINVLSGDPDVNQTLVIKHVLNLIESERDIRRRSQRLNMLMQKYPDHRMIVPIVNFSLARIAINNGNIENAKQILSGVVSSVRRTDLLFYRAHNLLGDLFVRTSDLKKAEEHISSAVNVYRAIWQETDFRDRIIFLINYYQGYAGNAGKHRDSSAILKKYTEFVGFVHRQRRFDDLYSHYGPQAHVAYIDNETKADLNNLNSLLSSYRNQLGVYRLDFDKAAIYGLGYIYSQIAVRENNRKSSLDNILKNLVHSQAHLDWALFIDDSFVDAYLLQSWIHQFVDLKRMEFSGDKDRQISKHFQSFLLERNVPLLERALEANNPSRYPEKTGMIYLNLGNAYFLLTNYPEALRQYVNAQRYLKHFNDLEVELNFRFHMGYCYWQVGDYVNGRAQMSRALNILRSMGKNDPIKEYLIYKYFAVFDRMERNNESAIEWYNKIISFSQKNNIKIDVARYYQEIAACYQELGNNDKAMEYVNKADELLKTYPNDRKTFKFRFYLFGLIPFSFLDLGEDTYVIGDNKIFNPLDTKNKRLLSISIREAMSLKDSDYLEAIEHLNNKKSMVRKRRTLTDAETFITCENNIGYYYFRLNDFKNSRLHFENAYKVSTDPKAYNLEGAFVSLMNLVSLYATIFETGEDKNFSNIKREITSLIRRAEKLRNDYEKIAFKIAHDDLKREAKANKRPISDSEISDLRQSIKEEADNIYYQIDAAIGILVFYYAEILREEIVNSKDARAIARSHSELSNHYNRAHQILSDSLAAMIRLNREDIMTSELPIRVRVNSAMCLHRLGKHEDARVLLNQARRQADELKFTDLSRRISVLIGQLPR